MAQELITLWVYRDLPEALLAKGKLESEGIECFLADDNMVRMDWFWSNAVGGIKLRVEQEDAEAALELLGEAIPATLSVDEGGKEYRQPQCPKCRSLDIKFESVNEFALPFLYVFSLPFPFSKKSWKCENCGNEWQDVAEGQTP
jgi:hypothetical protein